MKVKFSFKYFRYITVTSAEAWSYCSSMSDGGMLRAWFSCSPFIGELGVKMAAPLQVCTKDEEGSVVRSCGPKV